MLLNSKLGIPTNELNTQTESGLNQEVLESTVDSIRNILPSGRVIDFIPKHILEQNTYTGVNRELSKSVLGEGIPEEKELVEGFVKGCKFEVQKEDRMGVLIVGPGWGRITKEVLRSTPGKNVSHLDINGEVLLNEQGNRVLANAEELPFRKDLPTYKGIIASVVLRYNLPKAGKIFSELLSSGERVLVTEYGEHGKMVVEEVIKTYPEARTINLDQRNESSQQDILKKAAQHIDRLNQRVSIFTRSVDSFPYTSFLLLLSLATEKEKTIRNISEGTSKSQEEVEMLVEPFFTNLKELGFDLDDMDEDKYKELYKQLGNLKPRRITQYIILGRNKK